MAQVNVSFTQTFSVPADIATVFALLSDVPASAAHFDTLDRLDDKGDNTYCWNMEKMGVMGITHQVIYTSKYVSDETAGTIEWVPVSGGNSEIAGSWKLSDNGNGTDLAFTTSGKLDVPVPRLMVKMAKGVVQGQFDDQLASYFDNLKKTFSS